MLCKLLDFLFPRSSAWFLVLIPSFFAFSALLVSPINRCFRWLITPREKMFVLLPGLFLYASLVMKNVRTFRVFQNCHSVEFRGKMRGAFKCWKMQLVRRHLGSPTNGRNMCKTLKTLTDVVVTSSGKEPGDLQPPFDQEDFLNHQIPPQMKRVCNINIQPTYPCPFWWF